MKWSVWIVPDPISLFTYPVPTNFLLFIPELVLKELDVSTTLSREVYTVEMIYHV